MHTRERKRNRDTLARFLFLYLAKRRARAVKSFLLFSEAAGKTRWSGRVRPEQGTPPASLREV